ncbi:M48 family metalloprotease [Nonomuraea sp. CA-141351]|uniref:M48 family metalloprotease n=1 Tax=Nonomuraea sp. CA-141351 TaxID=3239996 RepID=UPI003D8F7F5B
MRIAVYLPMLTAALLAATAPWLARRLPPATATWLLVLAGVGVAASTTLTLILLAWTVVIESPAVAALGSWSPSAWDIRNPVPDAVAVLSLITLIAVLCSLAGTMTRLARRSAGVREVLGGPGGDDRDDVVVVDHNGIEAFAVAYPRGRGRIVISTGMLHLLTEPERRALIAHEHAHLRHRHHRHRAVTAAASALNPLLWPLRRAVEFATERWADEQAVLAVGDRPLVAQALARAALARRGPLHFPAAMSYDQLNVPERVRHLLQPRPHPRPLLTVAIVTVLVLTLAAAGDASEDTGHLLDQAGASSFTARAPTLGR